jgi:hypothetical protein
MKIEKGTVSVKFENRPDPITREVSWKELETAEDVLNVLSTPGKDGKMSDELAQLIKNANYGANLSARSKVRAEITATEGGPDKAIDKAIKDLVKARAAMGRPITEEAAKALIMG